MSEPMVRVVDSVCPVHGRAQERPSGSRTIKAGRDCGGVGFKVWTESAEYIRTHTFYCALCVDEPGTPLTPVLLATEPAE